MDCCSASGQMLGMQIHWLWQAVVSQIIEFLRHDLNSSSAYYLTTWYLSISTLCATLETLWRGKSVCEFSYHRRRCCWCRDNVVARSLTWLQDSFAKMSSEKRSQRSWCCTASFSKTEGSCLACFSNFTGAFWISFTWDCLDSRHHWRTWTIDWYRQRSTNRHHAILLSFFLFFCWIISASTLIIVVVESFSVPLRHSRHWTSSKADSSQKVGSVDLIIASQRMLLAQL